MSERKTNNTGGRPMDYDTSVALAGTPNVHAIYEDLGRYGTGGYIINDHSTQSLYVYVSNDGVSYSRGSYSASASLPTGGVAYTRLKPGEGLDLSGFQVHTLKIDASGNTNAYRIHIF
jgi:hypothetical protein